MTNDLFLTKLPNFLQIQRSSFCWFLTHGLSTELKLFSSIIDFNDGFELRFFNQEFRLKKKREDNECKRANITYMVRIFLPIQIINQQSNQIIKNKNVFFAQFPLMTNNGTFIINGCERVVVNQILRCPGLYCKTEVLKEESFSTITLISQRGSWLRFEFHRLTGCWVKVDKKYQTSIYDFLYGIGFSDQEINIALKYQETIYKYKKIQENIKILQPSDILPTEDLEKICSRIFDIKFYELGKIGRLNLNKRLGLKSSLDILTILPEDIFAILDYFLGIKSFLSDDIDDLRNRRVRSVGEIIQNQFRIGLNRLERNIIERVQICEKKVLTPSNIINSRPLVAAIKEFFGSSQLSQYMDQVNPLSELAHKRRLSALGPGGLNADRVTLAARDIHPSQYGRICPIETPEGQNVGLVGTLACFAKVNYDGFIETPYLKVKEGQILYNEPLVYLTASEEENSKIAAADINRTKDGCLIDDLIVIRFNQEFVLKSTKEVDFISISPIQIISVAASLIPFLEHDDANRALMGANMQKQAVPLLYPQKPIVGTGLEIQIARDSCSAIIAIKSGIVEYISSEKIVIKNFNGETVTYFLKKYQRSNQDTCINQRPLVWIGEEIQTGQIISDGPGIQDGELALGQNLTVAYMPWEGYNFEDAILVSDKLVFDNLFTSIHIEKYETEIRQTKTGAEILTSKIPFVNHNNIMYLDENGIVCRGTLVQPGDILVGRVTPKTEFDQLPEARLLKAIFGYKAPDVRDTSLRVPTGIFGRVLDVIIFIESNNNEDDDNEDDSLEEKNQFNKQSYELKENNYEFKFTNNCNANLIEFIDIVYLNNLKNEREKIEDNNKRKKKKRKDKKLKTKKLTKKLTKKSDKKVKTKKIDKRKKENDKNPTIGVNSLIQIFIAQIRKIRVGDKIAGRHGNKGVISRILAHQDMPYLPDGTIIDIILNPLGVPSRMNVGQIFECLLGLAGDHLNKRFKILPFDEMYQNEASRILINQKLREAAIKKNKPWLFNSYSPGKILLCDGRTGEKFDNPILVGRSYILKLAHLVDDKIHARSTGPYSLITQQPVGGRAQNGGQRFGEMEVWALEAYGSAYTLQELLTIKSDDMQGRDEVLNSIVCGQQIPKSGIPESFKVLIRELQSLGLDIKTYKINKIKKNQIITTEIDLMKTYEITVEKPTITIK